MAGAGIRVDGLDAALAELGRLAARTEHPRGLYEQIGASLVTSTQRRFETGRAPGGSPWPPSIRALAQGGKTMVDSARLLASQTHIAGDSGVEVGTNVLYAAIHQFGGTITAKTEAGLTFKVGKQWVTKKQVKIPARPFIGLDDDDATEVVAIAEDYLRAEETRP